MEQTQKGGRFLVVEDEFMIAMLIEDYLAELGHEMAWQSDNISEALEMIEGNPDMDGAMLDMNLRGESARPIADRLEAKGIPFCFMTGYGAGVVTSHPHAPIISKPFDLTALRTATDLMLTRRGSAQRA